MRKDLVKSDLGDEMSSLRTDGQRDLRTEVILTLSVMFLNARKSTLRSESSASIFGVRLRSSPKIKRSDVSSAHRKELAKPLTTERVAHKLFEHLRASE